MTIDSNSRYRVLITCPQMQRSFELYRPMFDAAGIAVDMPNLVQQLSEEELLEIIGEYDGMIAGDDPVTARVLAQAERIQIISKWGVGTDNVDLEAALAFGIPVKNMPGSFGSEVADVTIGYLIMLARQLHKIDSAVRDGQWPKIQGRSLSGKTLGILGLGSIGFSVARRALAMDMHVVGYDVMEGAHARAKASGVEVGDLGAVLGQSDFLALCCPLTDDTRHVINRRTLGLMKQGVSIINTARGALIDESALVKALQSGKVRSAALDVFEEEPLPLLSTLRRFDQVIFGAHNSSNTLEGTLRVNELAIQHLFDGLGCAVPEEGHAR